LPDFRHGARTAVLAGAVLALGIAGATAQGADNKQDRDNSGQPSNALRSAFSAQHGETTSHLPAARENIEVVGKVELNKKFGNVVPGQIADVAVYKNTAYLNSWSTACERGGTFIVDISNPADPKEIGHVPAPTGSYHGEGAHVITLTAGPLKGHDILGVNNEPCNSGPGGFDLIDVTDPTKPVILAAGYGDTGPEGSLTGNEVPNSNHSIFMWQFKDKAYAVTVDNLEAHDIDIFDITDPRNPVPVAEHALIDLELDNPDPLGIFPESTTDNTWLHHDSTVKMINGVPILLTSYWDAGYETFDASDPAHLVHISDSSFEGPDPLLGLNPQEGNAHYAEFSHDNKYILAADEDFSAYRPGGFAITTGPNAGEYPATAPSGSTGVAILPDQRLNGTVVYGGFGCPAGGGDEPGAPEMPIPQRNDPKYAGLWAGDEEAILVLSRGPSDHPDYPETDDTPPGPYAPGGCYPGEKVGRAMDPDGDPNTKDGWDAVVLVDRHHGTAADDSAYCGSGAYEDSTTIPSICTTHEAFHLMFDDAPNYDADYTPDSEPDVGDIGESVESEAIFDGWGYAHLYDNTAGTMKEIGAYAIEESLDPRFAFGFGDLSIHEWATDPTENIAYSSYYAGGVRVVSFGADGIKETGKFIDAGGNNFWGIEQFTAANGERLLAASDRDYGLYILRYTGPGAAKPPACQDVSVSAQAGKPVSIPLTCSDPNGNPLTLAISAPPAHGTLGAITGNAVTYTPATGYRGDDTFTYLANDGAANSALATVRIRVVEIALPSSCGLSIFGTPLNNTLNGTVGADTILAGAGNDRVSGQQGNDCLFGEAGDDTLDGGSGDDLVRGGTGKDRLFGDSGKDDMQGASGNDHVRGSSGNDKITGNAGNDYLSGGSNNDTITGGTGRDSIIGDAGNDTLKGDSGNDSITDAKGRNTIDAGSGNDRVNAVNGSRDRISCGSGRDVVRADRTDRVSKNCERVIRTRTTRR
jgi:hypothetical protein